MHQPGAFSTKILLGSAPRAADAVRYARARQRRMQLKTCTGGGKKRPMIRCEQRFDNAKSCFCRANYSVVLRCALCFSYRYYVLIGSTGVLCVGEKQGVVQDQIHVEKEKRRKVVHKTRIIPGTALCSEESTQRSTTQDCSEGHTAPHRTALRCAAWLHRAELI